MAGVNTSLLIYDRSRFSLDDLPLACLTGVLRDSAKVSLIQCVPRRHSSTHGSDGYDEAVLFPHFVIEGDAHLSPDEKIVRRIEFLIDDASRLFCDYQAFGTARNARECLDQMMKSGTVDQRITIGESPEVFYFTGRMEICAVPTTLGLISVRHSPTIHLSDCGPGGGEIGS